jgi:hypothetical protein
MPESRKRGGKKAHNKRMAKRNATIAKNKLVMERKFMSMLKEQMALQMEKQQQNETSGS